MSYAYRCRDSFWLRAFSWWKPARDPSLVRRDTKDLKCSLSLFCFGAVVVQNAAGCTQGVLMLGLVGESVQRLNKPA